MGANTSASGGTSAADGGVGGASSREAEAAVRVKLEDLELPPRRDTFPVAAPSSGAPTSVEQMLAGVGGSGGAPSPRVGSASVTEEIFRGGEPLGQRAFQKDGLVGTETQQLSLLAHYAELCEDFRRFQQQTRAEGAPLDTAADGAQLLLLSGAPGTGKTQHAVSFSRALGLPLLMASPAAGGANAGAGRAAGWSSQLRKEVNGRDCVVFFDEIDQHTNDESFASELRQFLDGVSQPTSSRVLLVGTTNRIDRLPEDVLHRAEIINFERPQEAHLAEMWRGYAQHLRETDLAELSTASARGGITGRDVRHCASWAERHAAIKYLNTNFGLGYCHGAALANCPPPPMESYMRCVRERTGGASGAGPLAAARAWLDSFRVA